MAGLVLVCDHPAYEIGVEAVLVAQGSIYALSERGLKRTLVAARRGGEWQWQVDEVYAAEAPRFLRAALPLVAALPAGELAEDEEGFSLYAFSGEEDLYLRRLSALELVASSRQGLWAPRGLSQPDHLAQGSAELVVAPRGWQLPEWTRAAAETRSRPSPLGG